MSCFPCCASEPQDHQVIDPLGEDQSKAGAKPVLSPEPEDDIARVSMMSPTEKRGFIEFPVSLNRTPGTKLGLELDILGKTHAQVCEVAPGCIKTYNQSSPAEEVKAGDFIVEVNGVRGDAKSFLKILKEEKNLNLVFRRGNEYTVSIETNSRPHGLILQHAPRSISLVISDIKDGPVTEWNEGNPDRALSICDRIVAFNGNRAPPAELLNEVQDSTLSQMDFVVVSVVD